MTCGLFGPPRRTVRSSYLLTPRAATSEAGAAPQRAVPADGARLAIHHLLDEAHTGMGDACEEIKPNLVGDVRPVAVNNDFVENMRGNH